MDIRTKILNAFKALRKEGYGARANFQCCSSCALALAPDDKFFVFWHRQDEQLAFGADDYRYDKRERVLHIRYCAPNDAMFPGLVNFARRVVSAFTDAGINPDAINWDGTTNQTIQVKVS